MLWNFECICYDTSIVSPLERGYAVETRSRPSREPLWRALFSVLVLGTTVFVLADLNRWCLALCIVGVLVASEVVLMGYFADSTAALYSAKHFVILVWPCALLVLYGLVAGLALYERSPLLVEVAVYSAYVNDVVALLVGRAFGRRYLNMTFWKFSPSKTWEGTIGGVIGAVTIVGSSYAVFALLQHDPGWTRWYLLSFVASIGAVGGDMLGSALKRSAGVKDSAPGMLAKLWMGHGGGFDRFLAPITSLAFVVAVLRFV